MMWTTQFLYTVYKYIVVMNIMNDQLTVQLRRAIFFYVDKSRCGRAAILYASDVHVKTRTTGIPRIVVQSRVASFSVRDEQKSLVRIERIDRRESVEASAEGVSTGCSVESCRFHFSFHILQFSKANTELQHDSFDTWCLH
jgi:hypothetical protein